MKAICRHCTKTFFKPTKAELGMRIAKHMEIRHPKMLGDEILKVQALLGVLISRHFTADPDIETDPPTVLVKEQVIEMIQGKREEFDYTSLQPGLSVVPAAAPPADKSPSRSLSLSRISDFGIPAAAPPATDPNSTGG